MDRFLYKGNRTHYISFPLGGIGAGGIGLAGNGHLIDWEIYNRPNKGSVNGFSHFAVRVEEGDEVLDARVLQGDLPPPYMGQVGSHHFRGHGFGPRREYLSGMPHFREVNFRGEFPMAHLEFQDETFPGQVALEAFSPFIPLKEDECSLPAAFFEIHLTNSQSRPLTYTALGVLSNPLPAPNVNRYLGPTKAGEGLHLMHLSAAGQDNLDSNYGTLSLGTNSGQRPGAMVSSQNYWFRGQWFDSLEVYWQELMTAGPLASRTYGPETSGEANEGMLAVHTKLDPGESCVVRFVISWHFPNCQNDWSEASVAAAQEVGIENHWRNYYSQLWPDSRDSAKFALQNWDRLQAETLDFKESLFGSTLPPAAIEAVSANLSTLKTPVVKRLEDGTLYGFEGAHATAGCCEGSCTHVWNYQQTVPFLFPRLERSMRTADYEYNLRPDGGMPFRIQLPLGSPLTVDNRERACADGQLGGVMKVYRDWKICGDSDWLRKLWPAVRSSISFAWHPDNEDKWDPDQTGVLQGRQHHTLDMELFGPNAWLTGFYLGALKAGSEMAAHLGDTKHANLFREIFDRGQAWANENLFNGEYYHQRVDLRDESVLAPFLDSPATFRGDTVKEAYWAEEYGELKYQIAEGCEIDQVLAQWHANLYGLGAIFDPEQTRTANKHLYQYNFKSSSREIYNPCRIYTLNDEGGLTIAVWPEGKKQPVIPLPYSQETQNGYEYAAAIQMIQNGLVTEGMTAIEAIRDRYDGAKRNPWNEIECGSNYARSMAAYALLNTFSGFQFDMVHGWLGFDPIGRDESPYSCLWSLDSGWGVFGIEEGVVYLKVRQGSLDLSELRLSFLSNEVVTGIRVGNIEVAWELGPTGRLTFAAPVTVTPETPLTCTVTQT